ncbi:MAG: septum formation inhibitor Maf [Clostridiales bacterium]|jgi:septum formation protein|nr:septum formation inhibitor Maf [Clostridiales bacterium]
MEKIILASESRRRIELLKLIFDEFEIIPADIDENKIPKTRPAEYAISLATAKASHVAKRVGHDCLVIGADTIVVSGNEIFGKPADTADAKKTLSRLSGRTHSVFTGIAVMRGADIKTSVVETLVFFRKLHVDEIERYIKTGEPMDKSGAYGIQGKGAFFVEGIKGDYFNVVGLPLSTLYDMLRELGIDIWNR